MEKSELYFKRAEQKDADLLFNWINDPETRIQSLSNHIISYDEHTNWFSKKLSDKNCYLYIVFKDAMPVGMIRFDVKDDKCSLSYLVDKLQRGKGIGSLTIYAGTRRFKKDSNFNGVLTAVVKDTNSASLKIFEKSGFKKEIGAAGQVNFIKSLCQ